ncbi:O-antigen ligase family protein [Sphingomonas sp. 22L2VL55-3]
MFLAVLLFGGGAGTGYPLIELAAQILALVLIVRAGRPTPSEINTLASAPPATRSVALSRFVLVFAAAALLLVAQLVPLPASWWHGLPARETAVQVYTLLGWTTRWHAFSMTPDTTFTALLTLLVPLAAMLTVAALPLQSRVTMLRLIVIAAVISTVLAALQVAAGGSAPVLYDTAHRGFGVGFFVNRNHQATFLLVSIVFAAVPGVMGTGAARRLGMLGVIGFLSLGILATSSRTALLLLPISLIVAFALVGDVRRTGKSVAAAAALYVVGGLLLSRTDLVQRLFARFTTVAEELRYQYWENSLYIVRETFPFGTGFGSFERVYRSVEPLGQVSPLSVNHAHNDFLELVLEGGLSAAILIAAGLIVLIVALVSGWRHAGVRGASDRQSGDRHASTRQERATLVAGGAAIALILLFSLVDYPLRMAGIAGLFGAALGLIAAVGRPQSRTTASFAWTPSTITMTIVAAIVGLAASGDAAGRFLTIRGQAAAATTVSPWSASAWSALANAEQLASQPAAARAAAARALVIDPIDAGAVRAHGYADLALDQPVRGSALLQAGAALGWRDTLMQLWLAERALEVGSTGVAAERIDALLRRAQLPDALMPQMRRTYLSPGGVDAVVARLGDVPKWRQGFFNLIAKDAAESVPRTLEFLGKLQKAGVAATPLETTLIRWQLGDRGDMAGARQVWLASGGRGLVADGGFEALPSPLPGGVIPYAWGAPSLPGVRVIPADRGADNSGHALQIVSDGLSSGTALAQAITLPPGRWRVSAMVRGADVPATLSLTCAGRPATISTDGIALDGRGRAGGRWLVSSRSEPAVRCRSWVSTCANVVGSPAYSGSIRFASPPWPGSDVVQVPVTQVRRLTECTG